jgi:hypothetical protein
MRSSQNRYKRDNSEESPVATVMQRQENRSVNSTARQGANTLKQSLNLSMEQTAAPITGGRFWIKKLIEKSIGRG